MGERIFGRAAVWGSAMDAVRVRNETSAEEWKKEENRKKQVAQTRLAIIIASMFYTEIDRGREISGTLSLLTTTSSKQIIRNHHCVTVV